MCHNVHHPKTHSVVLFTSHKRFHTPQWQSTRSMHFNMEYCYGAPSPNKTPRKKNRLSGYSLPFFPVALPPAPVPNLDGLIAGASRLSQCRIPQQENEQLCLDNFPDMATVALLGCDWARVGKCLCSGMAGPSLIQCKMVGCVRLLHHMCQTEWESEDPRREAHGSRSLCAYHHPALAGLPADDAMARGGGGRRR